MPSLAHSIPGDVLRICNRGGVEGEGWQRGLPPSSQFPALTTVIPTSRSQTLPHFGEAPALLTRELRLKGGGNWLKFLRE